MILCRHSIWCLWISLVSLPALTCAISLHFADTETSKRTFRRESATEGVNVILAREGYLGTSPVSPTVAIAFQTLEAYRQLHRVCPRLSLQAQVRVLCYLHALPYQRTLVDQFSIAYDQYLDILEGIDSRVRQRLGQDGENWRMLNACAPCLYKLEDEPQLKYSLLVSVDGNQSLKLVDSKFRNGVSRLDSRRVPGNLFIPEEIVDLYKDEVSNAKRVLDHVIENGDVADSSSEAMSICEERWRNAGPEARKKMFALFAVSGVFVCLCRHGQVLIMCDMIRSGELMKYGLAIVAKLIDVYGEDIMIGYDIGCEFLKTVQNSRLLGAKAAAARVQFVVPAFHGHSHNRGCQVNHLPLYVEGVGKEDFEGNERFFSSSNNLAAGTRLSTPFHRHQTITQFAAFWTHTKHAETGNFIHQNYKQALEIIRNDGAAFTELAARLKITGADCERYLREERAYLERRKQEPKEVTRKIEYIQALLAFEKAGYKEQDLKQLRTRAKAAFTRWETAQERVLIIEDELKLSVEERWVPKSKDYEDALSELTQRQYRLALDNLERLIVQRLFELTKLGMSGYKLREKIGKALKARAEAIKTALNEYNRCAARLKRPALSWNEVMDMITLAEFDLLRETREDIRQFPWAQRINRQAMNLYYNVLRAREEIERLDVEIPRTFTALLDRHYDYQCAIASARSSDPGLAHELHMRWVYEDRISARITARLYETSQLEDFSGKLAAGKRVGRNIPDVADGVDLPSWACRSPAVPGRSDEESDEETVLPGIDDEREADQFVDFIDGLGEDSRGSVIAIRSS
ncbi:hypothetical protein LXA43DRAFT_907171 [Ganoderma leucocontextum]|nr:hypothetical protein LXA43DRAFT_907171 [Ganoderma leucocontextum]